MGSRHDVLWSLSVEKWVEATELARRLGLSTRAVGARLRTEVAAGRVERSEGPPVAYRLAPAGGGTNELVTVEPVELEQVVEERPVAFAVWDDGSVSIAQGELAINLAPSDVQRLTAHLQRYR